MVSLTFSVDAELKKEMDKYPEYNWSEIARQSIRKKLKELEAYDKFIKQREAKK